MKTIIYCGGKNGQYHPLAEDRIYCGVPKGGGECWFFPEIDYGCCGGPVARHPARIVELVPEMIGKTIITMSEHIILAFQQLVRDKSIEWCELELYCGNMQVYFDSDGDLEYWPGGFFNERLELLR